MATIFPFWPKNILNKIVIWCIGHSSYLLWKETMQHLPLWPDPKTRFTGLESQLLISQELEVRIFNIIVHVINQQNKHVDLCINVAGPFFSKLQSSMVSQICTWMEWIKTHDTYKNPKSLSNPNFRSLERPWQKENSIPKLVAFVSAGDWKGGNLGLLYGNVCERSWEHPRESLEILFMETNLVKQLCMENMILFIEFHRSQAVLEWAFCFPSTMPMILETFPQHTICQYNTLLFCSFLCRSPFLPRRLLGFPGLNSFFLLNCIEPEL